MKPNSDFPQRYDQDQKPIIATASNAALSKLSTTQKGYYYDPFLPYFVKDAVGLTTISSSTITSDNSDLSSLKKSNRQAGPSVYSEGGSNRSNQFRKNSVFARLNLSSSLNHNLSIGRCHPPPAPSSFQLQQQPIIRRGTHARICLMDHAISAFLSLHSSTKEIQVLILGSGRDTTYLRSQCDLLHHRKRQKLNNDKKDGGDYQKKSSCTHVTWYEIDHPSVIRTKYNLLKNCPLLNLDCRLPLFNRSSSDWSNDDVSFMITPKSIKIPNPTQFSTLGIPATLRRKKFSRKAITFDICGISDDDISPQYHLIGFDLRNSFSTLLDRLCQDHFFNLDTPTLIVLECVQMYLSDTTSRDILRTVTESCSNPYLILYDPTLLNDPFGKIMQQNLSNTGISHPSLSIIKTRTLQEQIDKLVECGFTLATGWDLLTAYETIVTEDERKHANMCEMLDEIEEWILIMKHYCFVIASVTNSLTMQRWVYIM